MPRSCEWGCYERGFVPLLPNAPEDEDGTLCSRYCTPSETHTDAQDDAAGASGNCTLSALSAVGGTNGEVSDHQCRFVQSFSDSSQSVDVSVGLCVPIDLVGGGSWSDCKEFAWEPIKAVWSDALAAGTDPQLAFDDFCLFDPTDPENSPLKDDCVGLSLGCISLQEREMGLPSMTMRLSRTGRLQPGRNYLDASSDLANSNPPSECVGI